MVSCVGVRHAVEVSGRHASVSGRNLYRPILDYEYTGASGGHVRAIFGIGYDPIFDLFRAHELYAMKDCRTTAYPVDRIALSDRLVMN